MGMFDYVRCQHPSVPPGREWQTKDLSDEMTVYEIRGDGTLWREEYDVEDHSDPNAEGIMALCGLMTRVRKRWEQQSDFTGEVRFYDSKNDKGGWLEFSAYFAHGKLMHLECVEDKDNF